jgi:hypothetical protein
MAAQYGLKWINNNNNIYQKCNFQQDGASPHKAAGPGSNIVNRAFWRKNRCQERVAASVTGPQSMRLFFVGLSQAETVRTIRYTTNIGCSNILIDERIRKHSSSNVKRNFLTFRKKVRIIDFSWWRSYWKKN